MPLVRNTCLALADVVAAGVGVSPASAAPASGAAQAPSAHRTPVANPYAPNYQHSYRHGALPTRPQQQKIRAFASTHQSARAFATTAATSADTLTYRGGVAGIGVTSGPPKVYLVFWGSQWGTAGTDAGGNVTLTGDPSGGAAYIQKMFRGLGTNNEAWSGTMTQYCDGPLVSSGVTSCSAGAAHVGYPTGGALAGVWYDNSAAAPAAASGSQLAAEAVNGAAHFGDTTQAANRYVQYVVLSPPGTNPDSYRTGGFCGWHSYTGSSYGYLAYTNMPYVMDMGGSCGAGFVNGGSGPLDGYSMVLGHEYAETITDQLPAGGWVNATSGEENADECAWIGSGQLGGAGNIATTFGSFAMQGSWSNDTNRCDLTHATVGGTGGANTVTLTNPGAQASTVGVAVSKQLIATDSAAGAALTFTAAGLPTGLSISSAGLVTGTPTAITTSSVTVRATDETGAFGTATFSWVTKNLVTVTNPGARTGTVGSPTSLQLAATDSAAATLTYSATGLPTGLSMRSGGLISGTPVKAGAFSVTIRVTDQTGAFGTVVFSWPIAATSSGCATLPLKNGDFETNGTSWTLSGGVASMGRARTGSYYAWLDGYGSTHTNSAAQTVIIPAGCRVTLSYYLWVTSAERPATATDTLSVKVGSTTVQTFSNVDQGYGYVPRVVDLSAYAGSTVTLSFVGVENAANPTSFLIDDVALTLG